MEVRETTVSEADVRAPTHFERRRVWASWLGCEIARAAPEHRAAPLVAGHDPGWRQGSGLHRVRRHHGGWRYQV